MSETITIEAPNLSGDPDLTLYLRSQVDNSLLNTGGDALTETSGSQGSFTATLAETRATSVTYRMIVEDTAGVVWYDWLDPGETRNREALNRVHPVNDIADAVLTRNVSNVEASVDEHTLATMILGALEWSISGSVLTIKRTDGTTVHYTKAISSASSGDQVITGLA